MISQEVKTFKKQAIIFDIDGTITDITHRRKYVKRSPKDWDNFNDLMKYDVLQPWAKALIKDLRIRYDIILITGREERFREITLDWLRRNDIHSKMLLMRTTGDKTDDDIVKKGLYERHVEPHYDIIVVFEDRSRVVKMWRDLGLTCLQCDYGDF
jgi:uncharacterized HAD superfamily protein